jgi:hypothetical protein
VRGKLGGRVAIVGKRTFERGCAIATVVLGGALPAERADHCGTTEAVEGARDVSEATRNVTSQEPVKVRLQLIPQHISHQNQNGQEGAREEAERLGPQAGRVGPQPR